MKIASYVSSSQANGPGMRAVVWFQGCDLRCEGCCNPEFQPHDSSDAEDFSPRELAVRIAKDLIDLDLRGLSLSGGEPLHEKHARELTECLRILRDDVDRDFDVFVFSGRERSDIMAAPELREVLAEIDMIIAGPFDEQWENRSGLIASLNQEVIRLSERFSDVTDEQLVNGERKVEIIIDDETGLTMVTGLSSMEETLDLLGVTHPPCRDG